MRVNEFIQKLKLAHDVPNYYCNKFPKNCGFYDGARFSWDCWNLIKTILAIPPWSDTRVTNSYIKPATFATGDVDGAGLLRQCTGRSKDFSNLKIPGTYLYISDWKHEHAGVYIGDFEYQGEIFNVVECTSDWAGKVQYTYVNERGERYLYKGSTSKGRSWTDYGLLTPYIDYNTTFSALAIDVSIYQKGLDLAKAKEEGFSHIIIRAGGGGNYADPLFNDFYHQAIMGDWKKAAYYYGNCFSIESAVSEAKHFISLLAGKNIKKVYYDVEGKMLNQDKTMLTNIILTFCNTLNSAGYECGIYASESHFNNRFNDMALKDIPHWVAKYSTLPPTIRVPYEMWQYGGTQNPIRTNKVAGIITDQNLLFEEWDEGGYTINGVDYSPVFDPTFYYEKYTDLQKAIGNNPTALWAHFQMFGMNEFRQAKETFNPAVYKENNPDVVKAYGDNNPMYYYHYCVFGKNENRISC